MENLRFIHGKKWHNPRKKMNDFDSLEYAHQEKNSAWAYEITSLVAQVFLIRLVALSMPFGFVVSALICAVGEWIMRANISAASRVILAKKDEGKKDVKGRRLLLPQSWKIIIAKAAVWVLIWGCFGFLNQKTAFDNSLGNVEYTQAEKIQLSQAVEQFNIDSSSAVRLLNDAKSEISKDIKKQERSKATYKQNQINAAQNALNEALVNSDMKSEIIARQKLTAAKSIVVSSIDTDYSQAESDYQERINRAKQKLTDTQKYILGSVGLRNGAKTLSHSFEMGLFGALVLVVVVCIYLVEEYKKLGDLDHFGIDALFVRKVKNTSETPQFVTVYEEITNTTLRDDILESCGFTLGQIKSAKARGEKGEVLLNKIRQRLNTEGYELYFKDGKSYPYLKRIKRKRA